MKFKDLNRGDKFIGYPHDDTQFPTLDERPYYVFIKTADLEIITTGNWINAIRIKDGQHSKMPDNMEVLRIE